MPINNFPLKPGCAPITPFDWIVTDQTVRALIQSINYNWYRPTDPEIRAMLGEYLKVPNPDLSVPDFIDAVHKDPKMISMHDLMDSIQDKQTCLMNSQMISMLSKYFPTKKIAFLSPADSHSDLMESTKDTLNKFRISQTNNFFSRFFPANKIDFSETLEHKYVEEPPLLPKNVIVPFFKSLIKDPRNPLTIDERSTIITELKSWLVQSSTLDQIGRLFSKQYADYNNFDSITSLTSIGQWV